MNASADLARAPIRIRLDQLVEFHAAMGLAMIEAGLDESRIAAAFATDLHAECAACSIRISGAEIETVALAQSILDQPRLERLRLGFCARADCQSFHYLVCLEGSHPLDWQLIQSKLSNQSPPPATRTRWSGLMPRPGRMWSALPAKSQKRVAVALAVFAVMLVWRLFRHDPTAPLKHFSTRYTVDPASIRSNRK